MQTALLNSIRSALALFLVNGVPATTIRLTHDQIAALRREVNISDDVDMTSIYGLTIIACDPIDAPVAEGQWDIH